MFDSVSRSDAAAGPSAALPASVRGDGEIAVSFAQQEGDTHIATLSERGGLRLRYPRAGGRREAVIVNTGGGVTGGDRVAVSLDVGAHACVVATTQAAEKIYRSDGSAARLRTVLRLGDAARLDWLPQETIVFDRAVASRELCVEMAATGALTMYEAVALGRLAHGETLRNVRWHDRWRIRRDGRLIFADDVRLEGDAAALMDRPALGAGARALATLLHVAPDADEKLGAVRAALAGGGVDCGASAWNGMLVVRICAPAASFVRKLGAAAIAAVVGGPMPRAWEC